MNKAAEVVLEPGTQKVRASDIPLLLARAIYPLLTDIPSSDSELARALAQATAEERFRKGLKEAFRSGELIARSDAGTPLDAGECEFLDLSYVAVEALRAYAKGMGIGVHIEPTVEASAMVEEIANTLLDGTRNQWDGDENKKHRARIAYAFCEHHVMAQLKRLVSAGNIIPRDPNTEIYLTGPFDIGFACDLYWKITKRDASNLAAEVNLNPIQTLHEVANEAKKSELNERIRAADVAKKAAAGRHTLEEAARMFASSTGESKTEVLNAFLAEVKDKRLHVYQPGRDFPSNPIPPRPFYEAYWDDLNRCLDSLKFRGEWRFPAAAAQTSTHVMVAGEPTWLAIARKEYLRLANEPRNYQPTQLDLCRKVEAALREQGVTGPHKRPLAAETIKKEAITGEWWQKHFKQKPLNSKGKGEIE